MAVLPTEVDIATGGTIVRVNLFKRKAGWSWADGRSGDTIVSVEYKGKHYFCMTILFDTPLTLSMLPESKSEPRLRPSTRGFLTIGEKIGDIVMRQGRHRDVYDWIKTSKTIE